MNTSNGVELCLLSVCPDFGAKNVPGMNVVGTEVVFKFRLCQQSIKAAVLSIVLGITDNSCSTKASITCLNAENQPLSRTAMLLWLKTGAPLVGTLWGRSRRVFLCVCVKESVTHSSRHTHTQSKVSLNVMILQRSSECHTAPPRLDHTESPKAPQVSFNTFPVWGLDTELLWIMGEFCCFHLFTPGIPTWIQTGPCTWWFLAAGQMTAWISFCFSRCELNMKLDPPAD